MKKLLIPFFIVIGAWFVQNFLPMVWWGGVLIVDSILGRPNIPYEDRSINITGEDKNNNGIRDDIERYLNENVGEYSYNVRMAYLEYAKSHIAFLTTDPKNHQAMKKANNNNMYRTYCTQFFAESMKKENATKLRKVSEKIRYLVVNTSAREKRYLKSYNPNLNGPIKSPYFDSRLSMVCGFQVRDLNRAIAQSYYANNNTVESVEYRTNQMLKDYPKYFTKEDKDEIIKNFNDIFNGQ